jgi:hypothetical protein
MDQRKQTNLYSIFDVPLPLSAAASFVEASLLLLVRDLSLDELVDVKRLSYK